MNDVPIVQLKDIYFKYTKKNNWILENVNLSISKGDKIGITGGNGCGKSTLSKLVIGITKPLKGTVNIGGKTVRWDKHYSEIGYIGDPGYNTEELGLPGGMTVENFIITIAKLQNVELVANEIIDKFDLKNLYTKYISELSTGQRKRLMAFATFIRKPSLIILDEPFDGLDRNVKVYLDYLLNEAYKDPKITLLLISHNKIEIDAYTDKVYNLEKGQIKILNPKYFDLTLEFDGNIEAFRKKSGVILGMLGDKMESSLDNSKNLKINLTPINKNE